MPAQMQLSVAEHRALGRGNITESIGTTLTMDVKTATLVRLLVQAAAQNGLPGIDEKELKFYLGTTKEEMQRSLGKLHSLLCIDEGIDYSQFLV